MNADFQNYAYSDLTDRIIRVFYQVYNELGHGFLESVYRRALALALEQDGMKVDRELAIPVWFRGYDVGSFRCDLLIESAVLLELKTADAIAKPHEAQVLNYLRATTIEIGLILNFDPKPQVRRLVFENARKQISGNQRSSAVGV